MKRSFLQLACVAAIGALATSVYAQTQYGSPAAPSKPSASVPAIPPAYPPTPKAAATPGQPDPRYQAALERCRDLTGAVRVDCLGQAKRDNDRSSDEMAGGVAMSGGTQPGGFSGPTAVKNK